MKKSTLLALFALSSFTFWAQVTPIISTTWNQGCNYNADCPTTGSGGACGKTWTGCNATAWAQIFKYYGYPTVGMGAHCNSVTAFSSHCVDFSIEPNYDYFSMPNNVTSANPQVARLMYHLGITMDMNWSGTSSNSFFSSIPLKAYFGYTPRMYNMNSLFNPYPEILDSIKVELDAGRPVFVKTNTLNHFYLIDGYNSSDQIHCNFGWGGVYDGYYDITNVNTPAGNATPHIFLMNIRPMNGTLETAKDTLFISAAGVTNQNLEFTSQYNWVSSVDVPWLTMNSTSGLLGYYNNAPYDTASYIATINNGAERIGHITINNGIDISFITVVQEESPLKVNPDTLSFTASGGTLDVDVDWFTWSSWNMSPSDTWISTSQSTGSGLATVTVSTTPNTGAQRSGYLITTAGVYTDTTFIFQEADSSLGMSEMTSFGVRIYPNPTTDGIIFLEFDKMNENFEVIVMDAMGQTIVHEFRGGEKAISDKIKR